MVSMKVCPSIILTFLCLKQNRLIEMKTFFKGYGEYKYINQ